MEPFASWEFPCRLFRNGRNARAQFRPPLRRPVKNAQAAPTKLVSNHSGTTANKPHSLPATEAVPWEHHDGVLRPTHPAASTLPASAFPSSSSLIPAADATAVLPHRPHGSPSRPAAPNHPAPHGPGTAVPPPPDGAAVTLEQCFISHPGSLTCSSAVVERDEEQGSVTLGLKVGRGNRGCTGCGERGADCCPH